MANALRIYKCFRAMTYAVLTVDLKRAHYYGAWRLAVQHGAFYCVTTNGVHFRKLFLLYLN